LREPVEPVHGPANGAILEVLVTLFSLPDPAEPRDGFAMRAPCRDCGHATGVVHEVNGQDTVRCAQCGRYQYNAPRTETGRRVRSINERPDIKPKRRARILARDNFTCVGCHRSDRPLHIGHLLSVKQGRELGAADELLYSDENLAAMCEECNLGFGETSFPPRLLYHALMIRVRATGITLDDDDE
jgi:5-methylcytosine-specific restriction endonuclease McrA